MLDTTIAGSLPKPSWLAEPEKLWAPWRLEGAEIERAQRDAALLWVKEQEDCGIDIVSNGEQFRIHFVHGFLEKIEGIDWQKKTPMGIRDNRYVVDVPMVTGPVRRAGSVHGDEVRFTRAHTRHRLKFTLPGPMTICDTIADEHLSYDFHWLPRQKGATARHAIYGGQWWGSDREKLGRHWCRAVVGSPPSSSSVLNGYPGSRPG